MSEILFHYHKVHPATWAYLSSLLVIALYFKFSRLWSTRNLDLILIILLAPGLLIVNYGREMQRPRESVASTQVAQPRQAARRQNEGLARHLPGGGTPTSLFFRDALPLEDSAAAAESPPDGRLEPRATVPPNAAESAEPPLAPARVQFDRGRIIEFYGFAILLGVGGLLLVRLLFDTTLVRRPLLEPNLSMGGLTFLCCTLLVFLVANIVAGQLTEAELQPAHDADRVFARDAAPAELEATHRGPGLTWLLQLPKVTTVPLLGDPRSEEAPHMPPSRMEQAQAQAIGVKTLAILGQLAMVAGMIVIGYWHFDNIKTGIGVATLYLLLPYTSLHSGNVEHVLPAALMIWSIAFYRRPLVAGILLGLAMGMVYYPLFLLPLWLSFYWERGLWRFSTGVAATLAVLVLSLVFTSHDWVDFGEQLRRMFGVWWPHDSGLSGVWGLGWEPVYRMPVLAAFIALSVSFALWPSQKNLGTLMSCSAALMLATQFWHGFGGGLFMAWFLPLALLTIFRPNLDDRVAQVVLGEGWFPRRREPVEALDQAA